MKASPTFLLLQFQTRTPCKNHLHSFLWACPVFSAIHPLEGKSSLFSTFPIALPLAGTDLFLLPLSLWFSARLQLTSMQRLSIAFQSFPSQRFCTMLFSEQRFSVHEEQHQKLCATKFLQIMTQVMENMDLHRKQFTFIMVLKEARDFVLKLSHPPFEQIHPRVKIPLPLRTSGIRFKQELRVHRVYFCQIDILNITSRLLYICKKERNNHANSLWILPLQHIMNHIEGPLHWTAMTAHSSKGQVAIQLQEARSQWNRATNCTQTAYHLSDSQKLQTGALSSHLYTSLWTQHNLQKQAFNSFDLPSCRLCIGSNVNTECT